MTPSPRLDVKVQLADKGLDVDARKPRTTPRNNSPIPADLKTELVNAIMGAPDALEQTGAELGRGANWIRWCGEVAVGVTAADQHFRIEEQDTPAQRCAEVARLCIVGGDDGTCRRDRVGIDAPAT